MVQDKTLRCRFDVAAPRHFLYPALLLLLAEEPRRGYRLVDSLLRLGFGPVDRPSIYRSSASSKVTGCCARGRRRPPPARRAKYTA